MIIVPPTLYSEIENIIDVCASICRATTDNEFAVQFCAKSVGILLQEYNDCMVVDAAYRGAGDELYVMFDDCSTHKVVSHVDTVIIID